LLASAPGSLAPISPAMKVPWPNPSRYWLEPAWESSERSGPLTTFPSPASPWTGLMPESIRATSIPAPVMPSAQAVEAPTPRAVLASE